jgi:hypothetical protein
MSTRPNTPALGPLGQKVFVGNNIGFREMRPQRSRLAAEALAEAAPLRPKSSIPNKPLQILCGGCKPLFDKLRKLNGLLEVGVKWKVQRGCWASH